jgi:tripartite-type tricarboxylate transporter receptor subunit TctC
MEAVHVPFKGGPEAIDEIIAGRRDFFFAPVGNARPFVKDGMLRGLVVNSAKRSVVLPDVPTTGEAGIAGAEYPFWIGMFVSSEDTTRNCRKITQRSGQGLTTPRVRLKLEALAA